MKQNKLLEKNTTEKKVGLPITKKIEKINYKQSAASRDLRYYK